jgi:hypothetical protein
MAKAKWRSNGGPRRERVKCGCGVQWRQIDIICIRISEKTIHTLARLDDGWSSNQKKSLTTKLCGTIFLELLLTLTSLTQDTCVDFGDYRIDWGLRTTRV